MPSSPAGGHRSGTGALVAVVVALFAAATAFLFVWPRDDELTRPADAIIVLSGGRGHRVAAGLRLWNGDVAPTLVLSDGNAAGLGADTRLCRRRGVVCFHPDPYSTQGEARWLRREADRRDWDSVVLVTSTYHLRRARMIFERCYDGRLVAIAAEPPLVNFAIGIAWEWPKSVYYLTLNRGC